MKPRALDALFLDAGGVLVHPNWARVADALGRNGIAAEAVAMAAQEHAAKRTLDTPGHVRTSDDAARGRRLFDLVLSGARVAGPAPALDSAWAELAAYQAEHNLWEVVPDEVLPALERFRRMGLTLVVVSNANGTLRRHLERLGLARFFDHVLDSHEEGIEKPDPRIFRLALERAGATPERTLHVGDLYHVDVVGARAAGIDGVLLDPAGLYGDADCRRVRSLSELADELEEL